MVPGRSGSLSSTLRSSGGVGSDGPKGPASVEPAPPRVRRMASRLLEERTPLAPEVQPGALDRLGTLGPWPIGDGLQRYQECTASREHLSMCKAQLAGPFKQRGARAAENGLLRASPRAAAHGPLNRSRRQSTHCRYFQLMIMTSGVISAQRIDGTG